MVFPLVGMSPVRTVPGVTVATYVPTKGALPYMTLVPSMHRVGEVATTTRGVGVSVVTNVSGTMPLGVKHVTKVRPGGAVGDITTVGVVARVQT